MSSNREKVLQDASQAVFMRPVEERMVTRIGALLKQGARRANKVLTLVALYGATSLHAQPSNFEILLGGGEQVCQAYVSALRNALSRIPELEARPWCHVDLHSLAPGFAQLRREHVDALDEAFTLQYRIRSFLNSQDQYRLERGFSAKDRETNRRATQQALKAKQLEMWRYSPQLDVNNDGNPDEVLWYRSGRCASASRPTQSILLIVDARSSSIAEEPTRRLFGDPRPYPINTSRFVQLRSGSLGVFRYQSQDYIYAWGNDAAWSEDKSRDTTVRVYLRKGNDVATVCDVRWKEASK